MAGDVDPEFSRDLGAQGWLGMSLPTRVRRRRPHRGRPPRSWSRSCCARGAPVGYHWIADRQSGPSIAANGTEEQKATLPARHRLGRALVLAIGMSEPDSGSDLASVRTARRAGGRRLARQRHQDLDHRRLHRRPTSWRCCARRRTATAGLTQFIIDRHTPGLTVSPIEFIDGTKDFCELSFDDVLIPDDRRLGEVGAGWGQNTSELALERGGVDRWMTVMALLDRWVRQEAQRPGPHAAELGALTARAWAFRGMSLAVARMVDAGQYPVTEAALIKEMATRFEQDCTELMVRRWGRTPRPDARRPVRAPARHRRPGRPVVDPPRRHERDPPLGHLEGIEERMSHVSHEVDPDLRDMLEDFFATEVTPEVIDAAERSGTLATAVWEKAESIDLPWIGIDEANGGAGGSLADLVALVGEAARRATPAPFVEHHLAAWLVAQAGLDRIDGPLTVGRARPSRSRSRATA